MCVVVPFDISENEPWNFGQDWESWYSSTNIKNKFEQNKDEYEMSEDCVIQEGPDLAFNSQQTSNAIRWAANPSLVNYQTKQLNLNYGVSLIAEVDMVWCPDDPSNPVCVAFFKFYSYVCCTGVAVAFVLVFVFFSINV